MWMSTSVRRTRRAVTMHHPPLPPAVLAKDLLYRLQQGNAPFDCTYIQCEAPVPSYAAQQAIHLTDRADQLASLRLGCSRTKNIGSDGSCRLHLALHGLAIMFSPCLTESSDSAQLDVSDSDIVTGKPPQALLCCRKCGVWQGVSFACQWSKAVICICLATGMGAGPMRWGCGQREEHAPRLPCSCRCQERTLSTCCATRRYQGQPCGGQEPAHDQMLAGTSL